MSHGSGGEQPAGADASSHDDAGSPSRNWMGYVSLPASALGLSPVGIVLGHLGLSAAARGRATNRPFAFAGMVVGYAALLLTVAAAAWLMWGPQVQETRDAQARADVTGIGAELARQAADAQALPAVTRTGEGYAVGAVTVEARFAGETTVTATGTPPADWCVSLAFEGGSVEGFSYTPTQGTVEGLVCD